MAEVTLPDVDELAALAGQRFTRGVALTTAIYAVVLALASLGGSNAGKDMLMAQQQASDQWAFYQAKVLREHLYRVERLRQEAALAGGAEEAASGAAAASARLRDLAAAEEGRYAEEKAAIEAEARRLEALRDEAGDRDPYFDYAEVLLQIAIVMATVAILASSRPIYRFSLVVGAIGLALTANGFTLAVRVPFLE